MGQREILEWLQSQAKINKTRKWYTNKEIIEGLKSSGKSYGSLKNVPSNVLRLAACNQIEWKGEGVWKHRKLFRAKVSET